MLNKAECDGERRWIVLSEDGRFAIVGCPSSEMTQHEIGEIESLMRTSGLAGWLAIMEGKPYGPAPRLLWVRSLADPRSEWDDAVAQFLERRKPSCDRGKHINLWAACSKWGERIRLMFDVLVIFGLGIMAIWFIRDVL
jgi:hypothetical protein